MTECLNFTGILGGPGCGVLAPGGFDVLGYRTRTYGTRKVLVPVLYGSNL